MLKVDSRPYKCAPKTRTHLPVRHPHTKPSQVQTYPAPAAQPCQRIQAPAYPAPTTPAAHHAVPGAPTRHPPHLPPTTQFRRHLPGTHHTKPSQVQTYPAPTSIEPTARRRPIHHLQGPTRTRPTRHPAAPGKKRIEAGSQVRAEPPARRTYPAPARPQRRKPRKAHQRRALAGKSRRRRVYPQQIVTTRLLYCLQDPFAQLSRLQRI